MLLNRTFQRIVKFQVSGGMLLMIASLAAIIIANTPLASMYQSLWMHKMTLQIGDFNVFSHGGNAMTVKDFINDALMAIFFFAVGLEIKREIMVGELSSFKKAMLPVIAACGGMIAPILVFFILTSGTPEQKGLAIPMATDIAFALGVLMLFGKRVPLSLKIFLTAFAVVDDIGGIMVIAFFYTSHIESIYLIYSAALFVILLLSNIFGIKNRWLYAIGCAVMWYLFMQSGIHATIAGVVVALTVPARPKANIGHCVKELHEGVAQIPKCDCDKIILGNTEIEALHNIKSAADDAISPLQFLEELLHRPVNHFIIPLFAFANAGVELTNADGYFETGLLTWSVAAALVLGKFIGIYLFTWIVIKLRLTSLGEGMNWRNLAGISLLGGIGFTVSIFIANLTFADNAILLNEAKIGVLLGTILSGILGAVVLHLTLPRMKKRDA